jgi:hypothetical protein
MVLTSASVPDEESGKESARQAGTWQTWPLSTVNQNEFS